MEEQGTEDVLSLSYLDVARSRPFTPPSSEPKNTASLSAQQYHTQFLQAIAARSDVVHASFPLHYPLSSSSGAPWIESYSFLRVASKEIRPDDDVILIRATIHGDEISGALTLLHHVNEIFDSIHSIDHLKLILYPLGNPSGFHHRLRYNVSNDRGSGGNNDFARYILHDGTIVEDLSVWEEEQTKLHKASDSTDHNNPLQRVKYIYWVSDLHALYPDRFPLPQETLLMHHCLQRFDPLDQVRVLLDIHQDFISPFDRRYPTGAAYHYAASPSPKDFGCYLSIIDQLRKIGIPILTNTAIDAGEISPMVTDSDGFIERLDGGLPDIFWRTGTCPHTVTIETLGTTSAEMADEVNKIWIRGLVELWVKERKERGARKWPVGKYQVLPRAARTLEIQVPKERKITTVVTEKCEEKERVEEQPKTG